jgi:hypothetical protein
MISMPTRRPAVHSLDDIFVGVTMGRVAIVADRHRFVAAVVPPVVDVAHHVTVDAGGRVVGEIGAAFGVEEGEGAQAGHPAENGGYQKE